jgi:hypothetical protein
MRPTPYQKIMRAAKSLEGVKLSSDDVFELSLDTAIKDRAALDDEEDNNKIDAAIARAKE